MSEAQRHDLTKQLDDFIETVVNLSPGRLKTLQDRAATIENVLRKAEDPEMEVVEARPQGSFAQRTIINPRDAKRGFDADLLVEMTDVGQTPRSLLKGVKESLEASWQHATMLSTSRRCVTVQYAGEFHIDVVPCVRKNGTLYIANRDGDDDDWNTGEKVGSWEATDPDGLTAWIDGRNAHANGHLVPTIRLCKYLRDYKGRPRIKSVILTRLLADCVYGRLSSDFEDLPTTLVLLLEDLARWCAGQTTPPHLTEPTCGAELRLDDTNWDAFRNQIASLAKRARAAYGAETVEAAVAGWRGLFGERFPAPGVQLREAKAMLQPGEEDLFRDYDIPTAITGMVTLSTEVREVGQNLGTIHQNSPLPKEMDLYFHLAQTTIEEPYRVFWKVKNRGSEAAANGQLRGEIREDTGGPNPTKHESTKWAGDHYVEIYVVKDGVCVAKTQQVVDIR